MNNDLVQITPIFYGLSVLPKDSIRDYGHALLTIAGSDGELSDPELEWLTVECAEAVGIEEDLISEWEEFDFKGADLEEIFHKFNTKSFANFNKMLIYDAIRMSSADGVYAKDEKESVYKAAKILKVPAETVVAIESLVDIEKAANNLRLTIL